MSAKTNRLSVLTIVAALAILIAWSIITEAAMFIPIVGFVIAFLLIRLCRRFTKDIMVDERIQKIDEKASATSYRISTILMAILGVVFIIARKTLPYEYEVAGMTLAYSACAIMLIHFTYYYFYKSKL